MRHVILANWPSTGLLALALAFMGPLAAQSIATAQEPSHAPLPLLLSPVVDKNFYVLSLLSRNPRVEEVIGKDAELHAMLQARLDAEHQANLSCKELNCYTSAMRFPDAAIAGASDALRRLYAANEPLRQLVAGPLRDSGAYIRYHGKSDQDLLVAAWTDAAKGINRLIDVYGDGKAPRSAEIDGVIFDVKRQPYKQLVHTIVGNLDEQAPEMHWFFSPSLQFALALMDANKRDEAGRHEPMESKDNAATVRAIPSIRWADYPYTVIVIPGAGGDRIAWNMNISPASKLRAEIAARRWKEKKAPLILTSGGYVHPNQTPYAEAIEMKKVLVEQFGVPASAIIVDPHARHTTTNMRNASRLIYRYGIPFDRKALITTDSYQSAYIESDVFSKRNIDELGYQPQKLLGRLNRFDLEFLPTIESLQIDPNDPLDP